MLSYGGADKGEISLADIRLKLLLFAFVFLLVPLTKYNLYAQQSFQIRSMDSGFAYQKGPIFLSVKKAFLINSTTSTRIRCPHVDILSPFQVHLNEVMVSLSHNGIYFSSTVSSFNIIGRIWQEGSGVSGLLKCFGKNEDRYIMVNFRLSDSRGLSGRIILGREELTFYWIDRIQALYIDLDGVDLANLSYFFYHKVEGQGKLKGGILVFKGRMGVKVIGGAVISNGWLSSAVLSLLRIQGVNIDSKVLPIDESELKISGDINKLKVWVRVYSILGRFRSQYFAPLKIPAILESSKEVGR